MSKVILVTGTSSGFGRMSAEALALAGYIVYASMRPTRRLGPRAVVRRFADAGDIARCTAVRWCWLEDLLRPAPLSCVLACEATGGDVKGAHDIERVWAPAC